MVYKRSNSSKPSISKMVMSRHFELGSTPFSKPQSWNLSVPQFKRTPKLFSSIRVSSNPPHQASIPRGKNVKVGPVSQILSSTPSKKFHQEYDRNTSSNTCTQFTIKKDVECPQLPIVIINSNQSQHTPLRVSESQLKSPSSSSWIPTSPPKPKRETFWNLTIPSPISKKREAASTSSYTSPTKKKKEFHRSRIITHEGEKSTSSNTLSPLSPQRQIVIKSYTHKIQEEFTTPVSPVPTVSSQASTQSLSIPPFSHSLINEKSYNELLQNALRQPTSSLTVLSCLTELYTTESTQAIPLSWNAFRHLVNRCVHQPEFTAILKSICRYYNQCGLNLTGDTLWFLSFLTELKTIPQQNDSLIQVLSTLFDEIPTLFYVKTKEEQDNIFHIMLRYRANYPSSQLIHFLLEHNARNVYLNSSNPNLLCKCNARNQYPLHIAMMMRRSISTSSLRLFIQQSYHDCQKIDLLSPDIYGCTPIHYLWMTRVFPQANHLFQNPQKSVVQCKSLFQQSLQQLYHLKENVKQLNILVDILFGSEYLTILKWLLHTPEKENRISKKDLFLHSLIHLHSTGSIMLEELLLLVLLNPQLVLQEDNRGKTIYHLASEIAPDLLLKPLLVHGGREKVKQALTIRDESGKLPLHYVISSKSLSSINKLQLVETMISFNPDSVDHRCSNNDVDLFPFMLAANDTSVCFHLLKMNPSLIWKRN